MCSLAGGQNNFLRLKSCNCNLNTTLFHKKLGKLRTKVPPTSALPLTQCFSPLSLLHSTLGSTVSISCSPDHPTRQGKSPSSHLFSWGGISLQSHRLTNHFFSPWKELIALTTYCGEYNSVSFKLAAHLHLWHSLMKSHDWFEIYFVCLVPEWQICGEVRRHGWLF